ncbi:hypothetical protein BD779DRAFT_164386 [Infundibulicybe gibba]|nr:hypothetical protein BD779DRAFT_164386 [Infundibulicybe gibba]
MSGPTLVLEAAWDGNHHTHYAKEVNRDRSAMRRLVVAFPIPDRALWQTVASGHSTRPLPPRRGSNMTMHNRRDSLLGGRFTGCYTHTPDGSFEALVHCNTVLSQLVTSASECLTFMIQVRGISVATLNYTQYTPIHIKKPWFCLVTWSTLEHFGALWSVFEALKFAESDQSSTKRCQILGLSPLFRAPLHTSHSAALAIV